VRDGRDAFLWSLIRYVNVLGFCLGNWEQPE